MTYRLTDLAAGELAGRREELIALCAQAFCGAPWHEPPAGALRTVDRLLTRAAEKPDFRCVGALDADDALDGFAAGWTGTFLSGEGQAPAFELAELVVAPDRQGLGIGRALHDALLTREPYRPALLMTLDVPELTGRYERWGWTAADRRRPEGEQHDFVVMRHA
ncbi:GNAT family N-acetyltransferase [Streptomyces sp. NPDC085481]|uniref:GNAT family N-acetyltransferase n=1 Tax=Streptomyces sp. NPDC085481 TaxID=3365727 RepID=UPI0037CD8A31